MVASAVGRRHEIAVRLSLGASRGRLLRQLLTESALLSVTGGLLGLLVCWWLTTLIARMENINIVPDLGTVMFTVAFAVGTGIIFGLSPALHATRTGTSSALRESGSGATGQSRLQRVFVITQIVFSQPLLVLIALVLASIVADGAELPKSVLTRVISARFRPINEGAEGQSQEAVRSLGQLVANQPDVEKVAPEPSAFAVVQLLAPSAVGDTTAMRANGVRVHVEGTSPGYFGLIDVPIVLGRDVAFSDTASDEYRVIIGSDVARTLFGEESPIGRTLTTADWGARESEAPMVVIGVFDAAYATTRGSGKRVYTARGQLWRKDGLLIRTRGPAMAYLPTLQKFVRSAAPSLPVTRLATLMDIEKTTRRQSMRMIAAAVAAGGLALLLASIGLFAVISLAVGQRRREIGIRIALGAEPLRVVKMFFLSGMRMSATGLLIGLPISVALTHIALLNGVLIGPEFNLPAVGIGIALIVVLVAATATWFPARRAATVDPALALRAE
jgi:predicted permease